MESIVIIGGGAAGLMTAYELSKHNLQVMILEAKDRLGGRIHTVNNGSFIQPIEAGAEFIHGDLPNTLSLLKEAGIKYQHVTGKMFRLEKGKFKKQKDNKEWFHLMKQMKMLEKDMTLENFLNEFFPDEKYTDLRESVKGFAGGFDLAEISKASVKSLYKEWSEGMGEQYRVDGGYQRLIDYLEIQCKNNGIVINKNCCVKKLNWKKNEVSIVTMCSRFFQGEKIIITVPVSVLQAQTNDENYIEFSPAIPEHIKAAEQIGFGAVIKIIFQFDENFWDKKKKETEFILTDEQIPTWWSQLPDESPILTGWLGGDKAIALKEKTNDEILDIGLHSLCNAFAISFEELKRKLTAHEIFNWCKEPDIAGGYTYNIVKSAEAKKILQQPVNDTLFFAGEALFEGTPVGTVEAALASGKEAALQVLKSFE